MKEGGGHSVGFSFIRIGSLKMYAYGPQKKEHQNHILTQCSLQIMSHKSKVMPILQILFLNKIKERRKEMHPRPIRLLHSNIFLKG